eukprot:TRINITY_DN20291_c0_g1_i1.p1 TRINITY_DN20291_c0_g1~~TRINITY_DN20291_c0_g1_i1.p1  ORF type:complete len:478 (+),score=90.86 TRINITY_DN20291_c0_g1_i1:186-1436(+)
MEQAKPLAPPVPEGGKEDEQAFYGYARAALVAVGIIKDPLPDYSLVTGGNRHSDGRVAAFPRPSGRIGEGDLHDVGRFLNRFLGLPPDTQNSLFEFFVMQLNALVASARKEGNFDSGIVDIKAPHMAVVKEPKTVHIDPMSGATTTYTVVEIDRGMTWEVAVLQFEEDSSAQKATVPQQQAQSEARRSGQGEDYSDRNKKEAASGPSRVENDAAAKEESDKEQRSSGGIDSASGFYCSRREWKGKRHYLLALERQDSKPKTFVVFRPPTGQTAREMPLAELSTKYMKMASTEAARAGWQEEYITSGSQCMHGPKCKVGTTICTVGRRVQHVHILAGLVFPVWGSVELALSKQVRLSHRRLRVVRIETSGDDCRRIVGIHVPTPAIEMVLTGLARLKAAQEFEQQQGQHQQLQQNEQ